MCLSCTTEGTSKKRTRNLQTPAAFVVLCRLYILNLGLISKPRVQVQISSELLIQLYLSPCVFAVFTAGYSLDIYQAVTVGIAVLSAS